MKVSANSIRSKEKPVNLVPSGDDGSSNYPYTEIPNKTGVPTSITHLFFRLFHSEMSFLSIASLNRVRCFSFAIYLLTDRYFLLSHIESSACFSMSTIESKQRTQLGIFLTHHSLVGGSCQGHVKLLPGFNGHMLNYYISLQ